MKGPSMTKFFFTLGIIVSLCLIPGSIVAAIMNPNHYWLSIAVAFSSIISTCLMLSIYDE